MNGLNVSCSYPVLVVSRSQNRHNGIGGAGCRGQNRVTGFNLSVIDARNDVFDRPFTGRGQDHLCHALGFEVARQAGLITPHAGVIDNNTALDAIFGVIDLLGGVGVDNLDLIAVGDKRLPLFINPDGALKHAVHRVSAEQTGALQQIILRLAAAHDNSPQPQTVTSIGFGNQNARHQPTNSAKTVEHDIHGLIDRFVCGAHQVLKLIGNILLYREPRPCALVVIGHGEAPNIEMAWTKSQLAERIQNRCGLELRQLVIFHLPHPAMAFHDVEHRLIHERAPIDVALDVALPRQTSHHRYHGFGERLAFLPV